SSAELSSPSGIAVDSAGNLYIVDGGNARIREVGIGDKLPSTSVGSTSSSHTILIQLLQTSTISNLGFSGSQSGTQEFQIRGVSGCVLDGTTTNSAGTICTAQVTFSPMYAGFRAGTLTISNASGVIGTVGLIGMGLGAQLVESPGSLATVAGGGNIVP